MRPWLVALLLVFAAPAFAVEPDEVLDDPVLEARSRELSQEIRCVVCQNESIDSSSAGIARDLRILLRERLVAGDSDAEVKDFLVARYGDYVLLRPPVKPATYLLWFGPVLVLVIGLTVLVVALRRRRGKIAPAPLSASEQARLQRLIEDDGGS